MTQDDVPPGSLLRALVSLAILVVAIGAVLFVIRGLRQTTQMQDCLASGRTNCVRIEGG